MIDRMNEGNDHKDELFLCLDSMFEDGYYYTKFDIGGSGHSITIKKADKEAFLDAFAKEWRERAEKGLVPHEEFFGDE